MPKLKTKKSAAKRFKITNKGKIKRHLAFGNHILTKKSQKRKRKYRQSILAADSDVKRIKKMLPYS